MLSMDILVHHRIRRSRDLNRISVLLHEEKTVPVAIFTVSNVPYTLCQCEKSTSLRRRTTFSSSIYIYYVYTCMLHLWLMRECDFVCNCLHFFNTAYTHKVTTHILTESVNQHTCMDVETHRNFYTIFTTIQTYAQTLKYSITATQSQHRTVEVVALPLNIIQSQ